MLWRYYDPRRKIHDYEGFVEKFNKPKKTTDDCYTPPAVYEAVKDWACRRYGIDPARTVRPFWPGGDYEHFDYAGAVVLDNPPFSCLAKIVRFYAERQIPYFLFAPGLTALGLTRHGAGIVYADSRITYHNGAAVNTAFATSYGGNVVEIAPDLGKAVKDAQCRDHTIKQTVYQYPPNLLTTQGVLALARHGVPYALPRREAVFIRALDEMKAEGKEAFGGALLISDAAASRKAVAEQTIPHSDTPTRVWSLSEREMKIVEELNRK